MTSTSPNPSPTQAVERIREIIVGRHLERLEQRVHHLEAHAQDGISPQFEDRLCTSEAKLEAIRENQWKTADHHRQELQNWRERHREEIQQLAAQIQQVVAIQNEQTGSLPVQQLETRIGNWLNQWQGALQNHLNSREQDLSTRLRQEVATLWETTESQITRLESQCITREAVDEKFNRIAAAARALAECASSSITSTP
jgi:hypothetical protein